MTNKIVALKNKPDYVSKMLVQLNSTDLSTFGKQKNPYSSKVVISNSGVIVC